ncbi:EEF1A lysine methyltransferase 4 [Engraulis encrasicolus]|uniref:EEF1A lysine methyltransferase 4 n=1 Tax=Engraulis encrasicolus TaxID=184585 RepID=UPI002FCF7451
MMEHLPNSNSKYKDVEYWDDRYKTEHSFEWFGDLSKFHHLLQDSVNKEDSILVLGCGNSAMSVDLYEAGFTRITNIDYSAICIDTMAGRHSNCAGMSWLCMDARRLEFGDGAFDVVLEKGTLDAMLVEEKDPWRVSEETARLMHEVLTEVSRVLKPGGRFVSVTFAQPHFRKRLYARRQYGWSIRHHTYGHGFHYFLYVLTKGEELSEEDSALEQRVLLEAEAPPTADVTFQEEESEDFLTNINL